jgi:hypothetical protein
MRNKWFSDKRDLIKWSVLLIFSLLEHWKRTPEAGVPLDWKRDKVHKRWHDESELIA